MEWISGLLGGQQDSGDAASAQSPLVPQICCVRSRDVTIDVPELPSTRLLM
jgi:hypothetical protein